MLQAPLDAVDSWVSVSSGYECAQALLQSPQSRPSMRMRRCSIVRLSCSYTTKVTQVPGKMRTALVPRPL